MKSPVKRQPDAGTFDLGVFDVPEVVFHRARYQQTLFSIRPTIPKSEGQHLILLDFCVGVVYITEIPILADGEASVFFLFGRSSYVK